jgi:hypothetical protein
MQLSLCFGRSECPSAADPRAGKVERILAAARRTVFYGPLLASAPNELNTLPPVDMARYLSNRERFRNPGARLTVVRADRVRTVPNGWRARLGFPAQAIAGTLQALLRLAGRGETLPGSARRVIVHTSFGEPLLPDLAREGLWRAFDLPVFEELRGSEGELLAFECDTHASFHLVTDSAIFEILDGELVITSLVAVTYPIVRLRTGLAGAMDRRACPCGEVVERFVPAAAPAVLRKPPSSARQMRMQAAAVV